MPTLAIFSRITEFFGSNNTFVSELHIDSDSSIVLFELMQLNVQAHSARTDAMGASIFGDIHIF